MNGHCGLRIADCGLARTVVGSSSQPGQSKRVRRIRNPQSAIRNR